RYGVLTLARRASDGLFKVADLALVQEFGEQMGLAIRVARMFRRRSDTAAALHASVQPRKWPDIPGVQIAATYLAATEDADVGGDFYDVYRTPDGWGLAVGDVSGKGEEVAAVTAAARYAIRVLARRCADPGEVLVGTNEIVLADELALDDGDILFFYTDGVAQARGPDNTYFQDRLADELAALAGREPEEVVALMRRAMNDFTGEHYVDDVTMLVMRASREDTRAGQRDRRRAASRRRAPG